MPHSRLVRAATALWSLWFAIIIVEPAALHSCPMHDGTQASQMPPSHSGMAGHVSHHPDSTGRDHSSHGSHTGCTCLGCCCVSTHAVLPTAAFSIELSATVASEPVAFAVSAPSALRPHALPFANGPPTRA